MVLLNGIMFIVNGLKTSEMHLKILSNDLLNSYVYGLRLHADVRFIIMIFIK